MSNIPESHLTILQSPALAYMATLGSKGEPQVSAVWFLWDGTHLLFAFHKKRQKYRILLRDPRVAIAVADLANPCRSLEIRGTVVRVDEDPDFHFINATSQKYTHRDAPPEVRGEASERVRHPESKATCTSLMAKKVTV
jgi:PPOX class probable F420-dependent enzyme